jgi:hypothetical protein
MKRIFVTITLAAAATWILVIPAAAQGRSQSHPGGGSAAAGSMAGGHGMGASGNSGNSGSGMSGPRTPGELLTQNTQLTSKLSSLLPAGTDLQTAASGFRNLGQFVAAVHVSHNLSIPFDQLKCTELATADACGTMTVPSKGSHLGQAIQALKPTMSSADSKAAAKQAEKEASADTHS